MTTAETYTWATLAREHEGFPLFLRFPLRLNYDTLQHRFPLRPVISHTFNFRRFDGLTEVLYNKTLEEFDEYLITYFEASNLGQVVLVETFGGTRNYYFYVAESVDLEAVSADIHARFSTQKIELQSEGDPAWKFIRWYGRKFLEAAEDRH